jgi:purine-binding chemotaxis protein CheW
MSTAEHETRQLVVFTLGDEQYAVPIKQVQEIIRYTHLRSVASSDQWVQGVLSLRGKIVPVYDLSARLGITSKVTEHSKIAILDTGADTVGLIVDDVDEVLTVTEAQLDTTPAADTTLIDAIAKVEDRLIVLLNPRTIFATDALAA